MRRHIVGTLGVLVAGFASLAWSPARKPITLLPASQLWVEGKSTIRDWKCAAASIQTTIDGQGENPVRLVSAGEKAITSVDLSLPTAKLDCGNKTMNKHMLKALKAEEHSAIAFKLDSYELVSANGSQKGSLRGALKLGGTEQPVEIEVDISMTTEGYLRVSGTYALVMSQYGIKPPSLMLGTMKVRDQVVVGFDLLLNQ